MKLLTRYALVLLITAMLCPALQARHFNKSATSISVGVSDTLKPLRQNIPQLNTIAVDPFVPLAYTSINISYERRFKNAPIGLRFPIYFGFINSIFAGKGCFDRDGHFGLKDALGLMTWASGGEQLVEPFTFSVGINPRVYLNKHKIVRTFIGPEVSVGLLQYTVSWSSALNGGFDKSRFTTLATTANFGVSINPVNQFNLSLIGGVGGGTAFSRSEGNFFEDYTATKWIGVWQLGLTLGVNF